MVKKSNMSKFQGKTFLITGGLGFVGTNLVSTLLSNNIKPIILDYIPRDVQLDSRYLTFNLNEVEFLNLDLTNQKNLIDTMEKVSPDYIIHLAAMTDLKKNFDSAFLSIEINIKGTLNLLRSVRNISLNSFVFMSTSDVYGGIKPPFKENQAVIPASPYSASKASAEMYSLMFSRVFEIPVVVLRSFNLYGKYQKGNRVIPYIIMKLLRGQEVELTGGEQKREFNYVDNIIDAILLSLITPQSNGKIINIGSGKSTSIKEIAQKIAKRFDLVDNLNFGAIPYRKNEIWDMYCDNTLAKTILGWEPVVSLDEGINRTINWFQETFTE
ncbi:MAG: NAD-dependent epimerase/dehydratase family protein [Candidatus Thorarchaeota archaeon]